MTEDIEAASYLAASGWRLLPEGWRGAAIWTRDDVEVLLPPTEVDDFDLRLRELVVGVASVEGREPSAVARDMASPFTDRATYQMLAVGDLPAVPSLSAGARLVEGMRKVVATAARTVVQGPQMSFAGPVPGEVAALLRAVELETAPHDRFGLVLGIPLATDRAFTRAITTQLYDAATAVEESVGEGENAPLDQVAAAGVSVDFCAALSCLAGDEYAAPFQLDFRWAHGVSTTVSPRTLAFPAGAGAAIRRTGARLRQLDLPGPVSITGRIETLHDSPGAERWRVRIRGDLRTDRGVLIQQAVWVRLAGPTDYRAAITAHHEGLIVHGTGFRDVSGARRDLAVPPGGLAIAGPENRNPDHVN